MKNRIISIIVCVIFMLSLTSIGVFAEGDSVISSLLPYDGSSIELLSGSVLTFSANVENAVNVKFFLDEEPIAEFLEDGNLSFELSHDEVGLGKKKFTVRALDEAGELAEESIYFETYVCLIEAIDEDVPAAVQTFDTMSDEYSTKTNDPTLISGISDDFGWTLKSDKAFSVMRQTGASGKPGDYALELRPDATGTFRMELDGWDKAVTDGLLTVEFDVAMSPANWFYGNIEGIHSYDGTLTWEEDAGGKGKIYKTDFTFANGEWVNLKYTYDTATEKCCLYINGNLTVDNVASKKRAYMDMSHFAFAMSLGSKGNSSVNGGYARFAIDNFAVYVNSDRYAELSRGYSKDEILSESSDDTIPFGSTAVYVEMPVLYKTYTSDDIRLYVNGKETLHSGVLQQDNKVGVILPDGIDSGDAITMKIFSDGASEDAPKFVGPIQASFVVGEEVEKSVQLHNNSEEFTQNSDCNTGDVLSATYTLKNNGKEKEVTLVMLARSDRKLFSMKKISISLAEGEETQETTISLDACDKAYPNTEVSIYIIK